MKKRTIQCTLAGALAVFAAAFFGCDPAGWNPSDDTGGPWIPVPGDTSPVNEEGCSRHIQLIAGDWICVDDVIAAIQNAGLLDEDGDGIPNLNDSDIDGDGIPNSHDPDIDGDGLFNGIDDDVDADGVPNELDADVDGDFIRNRWDLDIDGDLVYNPYDRDADGDGFDDDDEARKDEDEVEDEGDDDDDMCDDDSESDCDSAMPDVAGMNTPTISPTPPPLPPGPIPTPPPLPPGPSTAEEQAIDSQTATALGVDDDDVISLRNLFEQVDRDLEPEDYLDGFHRLLIDAMEDNPAAADEAPGRIAPAAPESVRLEVPQRFVAVVELAEVEADLPELIQSVDALTDAARELSTALANLVRTAVAYGTRDATPDATEATSIAIEIHEITEESEINHSDVAEIIPPSVTAKDVLNGPSDDNNPVPVFRLVAELSREFQDDSGNATFAPLRVAQMIERLALAAESPSIESLHESGQNILTAADGETTLDPLAMLDAFVDAGVDPTDGVSEDEAAAAASQVSANASQED